jgi:hypothetical protein
LSQITIQLPSPFNPVFLLASQDLPCVIYALITIAILHQRSVYDMQLSIPL